MSTSTVYFLLPEIVVIAAAVLIYIAGAFLRTQKAWSLIALVGIILSMVCLCRQQSTANCGVLLNDGFTLYIRWLTLVLGLLLVLLNFRPLINGGTPEAIGSLLLVIAGHFGIQPILAQLKSDALPSDVMQSVTWIHDWLILIRNDVSWNDAMLLVP